YSKPPSAPEPSLPRMLRLRSENDGSATANGWYAGSVPRAAFTTGKVTSAMKMAIIRAPPALCTHLPTPSPTNDRRTMATVTTRLAAALTGTLPAIQAALGPSAYERFVETIKPISDVSTIT